MNTKSEAIMSPSSNKAFFDAIARGDEQTVQTSLDAGNDPNKWDSNGKTPLMVAAQAGHAHIVRLLLANGSNPNLGGENGSAIESAACGGNVEVVRLLVDSGAIFARVVQPLALAASLGNIDVVTFLVETKLVPVDDYENCDWIPLHLAVAGGHVETVAYLLKKGSNPSRGDSLGLTAFDWAEKMLRCEQLTSENKRKHTEIVDLLRAGGRTSGHRRKWWRFWK